MAKELKCSVCGKHNPHGAKFCNGCGAAFNDSESIVCDVCGGSNPVDSFYCNKCGAKLKRPDPLADSGEVVISKQIAPEDTSVSDGRFDDKPLDEDYDKLIAEYISDEELLERIFIEKYEPKGLFRRTFYKSKDLQAQELEKEKRRIIERYKKPMPMCEAIISESKADDRSSDSGEVTLSKQVIVDESITDSSYDTIGDIPRQTRPSTFPTTLPGAVVNGTVITDYNGTATDIVIPQGITEIGESAFCQKSVAITSVVFPSSLKKFGGWAFSYNNMERVELPDSVEEVGYSAFGNCDRLKSIIIPKSVRMMGNHPLSACGQIDRIYVDPKNPVYYSKNNCLINRQTHTLVHGTNISEIPQNDGIEVIGEDAFYCRMRLQSISIPYGVHVIGASAFNICNELRRIDIPVTVKLIGLQCFRFSVNLKEIHYSGTKAQWRAIEKEKFWIENNTVKVFCSDGVIEERG